MEKSNSRMHGHDMPIETKSVNHKPLQKNNSEMPTKETETIQVHETKHQPFVIVEVTKTDNQENEEKVFKVGAMGHFMSEKDFKTFESAEKYVNARPWDLITNLICLLIQNANEYEISQSKH